MSENKTYRKTSDGEEEDGDMKIKLKAGFSCYGKERWEKRHATNFWTAGHREELNGTASDGRM